MNFDSGHESHRRTVAINIVVDKIQFQTRCENMTDCGSCAYFLDEEDAIIW
jgi:ferredoxin